jgi:hypothetical protein
LKACSANSGCIAATANIPIKPLGCDIEKRKNGHKLTRTDIKHVINILVIEIDFLYLPLILKKHIKNKVDIDAYITTQTQVSLSYLLIAFAIVGCSDIARAPRSIIVPRPIVIPIIVKIVNIPKDINKIKKALLKKQ